MSVYRMLFGAFGPQGWWPGETPFEIIVGAILTQGTSWRNVERAIANLRRSGLLTPARWSGLSRNRLSALIRPAGYYNVKAARLLEFIGYLRSRHRGSVRRMLALSPARLREELLSVRGIGPETADSILLYAAGRAVFVVDAYTRRVFSRHGFVKEGDSYLAVQEFFSARLPADPDLYGEYHALIVRVGKEYCRLHRPRCRECPLQGFRASDRD